MKTAYRWFVLSLLLISVPGAAERPREARAPARAKPLFVDGVRHDPAAIEQLQGQPMYWVVESDAVHGFATPEGVQSYGGRKASVREIWGRW